MLSKELRTFAQCFSPASYIIGNRVTKVIKLYLIPNPLFEYVTSDNMCQVLNGKASTVYMYLNSGTNSAIRIPSWGGIFFRYYYNQNITVSYKYSSQSSYDTTLTATFGAFQVFLDDKYEVNGSVSDVYHTLSNQSSCFADTRLSYSLVDDWFAFDVEPQECTVPVFTPYFEYKKDNKWARVPIRSVATTNKFLVGGEFTTANTAFLNIKRYLFSPYAPTESSKYTATEKLIVDDFVKRFKANNTLEVRLSVDYPIIGTTFGSITASAEFIFSNNSLNCYESLTPRASLNNNELVIVTGLNGTLSCLEVDATDPDYAFAQNIKQKHSKVVLNLEVKVNETQFFFNKTVPIAEFLQNPQVFFDVPEDQMKYLMDQTEDGNVQVYVEIQGEDEKYLIDFNTPFIPVLRTCINKIVAHQTKDHLEIVTWMKEADRCQTKEALNSSLNLSVIIKDDNGYNLQQIYSTNVTTNYTEKTIRTVLSCTMDIANTPDICEATRQNVMKAKNRINTQYFYVTDTEYAKTTNMIIETNKNTVKTSFGIFGGLLAAVAICVVVMLEKNQLLPHNN
ncbi:Conserved_hypothetical protein [Hexamita inflata]|uniref:Uncharacterized protein n=1 Tax=Hexamita inflata TaxID=28002 RepID=A0AA86NPC1_9EUKA|nr:Conserved hypothetical protein [Hexamita inflata]